ncbi:MAG TPA: gluconeogenesis factor YvcK family protein [Candidatus Acidoferrum sp.]|nr:gluconeogenesis factor YvcK family protein [Candidatus Acidoferrum sp.]
MPRLVAIGGRSGPSLIVRGFRDSGWAVTALVATTDTGSSSGVIRDQFGLPAPGDIRSVLAAAANPRPGIEPLVDLFEFRFCPASDSSLRNMALGNLILTAFALKLGTLDQAVEAVARLFDCWAVVLPVPSSPATLCARLADGRILRGELNIRAPGKPPITEVFLEPADARVSEAAVQAIQVADLIVLGPGGLYCSVLPGLLPMTIRQAIQRARAKIAYVCNTTTQPGQTDGFDAVAHVQELLRYLGGGHLDYVLLNTQIPSDEMTAAYRRDNVHFMPVTPEEIRRVKALGPIPIVGNFVEEGWQGKRALHKLDTIRHDPHKVATSVQSLISDAASAASDGSRSRRNV